MPPISYKTVAKAANDTYIVNKSRFIGHASPAQSEEEALTFLKSIREHYRDASHNCYAYIIGKNAGIMRYSDDGEPGGTAGMPMIEVLKKRGVVDCCCVVTRYFGGVLLGAGGLVRAYSHSASIALAAAGVVVMQSSARYLVEVAYPLYDRVEHALRTLPVLTEGVEFTASVHITLLLREVDAESVLEKLTALTDGQIEYLELERMFAAWREAGESAISQ